jgi:ribosomal protein L30E
LKITDIGIEEMDRSANRGRTRSPETKQLVETISSLKSGDAKAVIVSEPDTPKQVRTRLLYAARIAGKRLQIAEKGNQVLFAVAGKARKRRRRTVVKAVA